jgi:NtrC-family two-component system sensor histidine kinase KinB
VVACHDDRMAVAPITDRVLEAMADAIVAADSRGFITLWNRGAERVLGWTAETMLGKPFFETALEPVSGDDPLAAALVRVRAGRDASVLIKRARADGVVLDLAVMLSPLLAWTDGPVDGWVAVLRDATRERAVQRELRSRVELVSRLAAVVADINSALDLPTLLRRISDAGRELLEADAAAYGVLDGADLVVTAVSHLPAEIIGERIPVAETAVGRLNSSQRASLAFSNRDFPNSSPPIAASVAALPQLAVALTHIDGVLSGALYVFFADDGRAAAREELDVLELLADAAGTALGNARAYERVQDLQERARAIVDATADGVAVLDRDGLVTNWNRAAAQLSGRTEAQAVGRPLPFPAEPGVVVEHQLDGGRWLEIMRSPLGDTGESVVDFRDISHAKAIEASKDLFLAVTSHELRTPITVVQGYATTLLSHWPTLSDDERRELVERIGERTRALAALVEQLLLGSRAGAAAPHIAVRFDVGGLLRSAVAGFTAVSSAHTFVVDIADDLPAAFGDPNNVEIVLGQLLENAVKYSPDGGEVRVTARADGADLLVEVADRGIGIPDGEHDGVFDRFYQVGGERRRFGGVGLGLYIVRKLLEAQGGSVRARPREGGGTCFDIRLPMAATDGAAAR